MQGSQKTWIYSLDPPMRRLLFLAVLIALGFLGYRIYTYQPPPERRLAPPGTFFLTHYVSSMTPTGVVGLVPGQEVTLVRGKTTAFGRRLVTDGRHQFEVEAGYLTDDIDVAANLRTADRERQKSAAATLVAEKLAVERAKRKLEAEMARKAEADLARMRLTQPHTTALDPPPRR